LAPAAERQDPGRDHLVPNSAQPPYQRSFNRFELKYLLTSQQAIDLKEDLARYMTVDPHGNAGQGYALHSVYADSRDFHCFWEKVEGIKFRRKLRFRRYRSQPDVFVEIKQRLDRTIQKRRVRYRLDELAALFGGDSPAAGQVEESIDPVLSEARYLWRLLDMVPVVSISYRRLAFSGWFERDLRVTLDSRVRYSADQLDIAEPFEIGKPLLADDLVVMEIKFDDRVPRWLLGLVARHQLSMVRLSKYCTAVDLEFFGGRNT
jgi:SPX domain protein involved in polyphosphate accumulation